MTLDSSNTEVMNKIFATNFDDVIRTNTYTNRLRVKLLSTENAFIMVKNLRNSPQASLAERALEIRITVKR